MWAMRLTAVSSRGSTPLRSASAFHSSIISASFSGWVSARLYDSVGSATVSNSSHWSSAKSWLPMMASRSAAVSWLTWLVTAFHPSWYMARLPQHS